MTEEVLGSAGTRRLAAERRVLPLVEGSLWHSKGFEAVAAALHER